ncbi:MAG: hypothetical protein K0V04_24010 [Deltaproteobacteria bacterium]|nr:hypothetical protein [Deltaproteobacteria bacterium]
MRGGLRNTSLGLVAALAGGCGDDLPDAQGDGTETTAVATGTTGDDPDATEGLDSGSSSSGEPGDVPWDGTWPTLECDSIVPGVCAFPYPSNVYTVAADTETGLRVEHSEAMMPVSAGGVATTRDIFNTRDGFSPGIALLAELPGATLDGLARPDSIERSLEDDSPTVLLDAQTGERVPHWAQLDMTTDDDSRRTFMIRPVERLEDGRRYIAAIRNVVGGDGQALEPSETFTALRDGLDSEEPSVESRQGLYSNIFGLLDDAGVARDDLQLAWDFTTASKEDNTGWLIGMRDEALASVGPEGPAYVIDTIDPDWSEDVAIRILGHMEVPLYLDQPGTGGVINLGDDGRPEQNGTAMYPFEVLVPYSAYMEPAALMQFGHGLFGSHQSVEALGGFANRHNLVMFAFDWIGMSGEDVAPIGLALAGGDLAAFETLPSRLLQSHVNALLGMRMMMGDFVDDPAVEFMGGSTIDPTERYYFGGSLGGIMGSVYMAITPDVVRGGLGVPGQSFNVLLPRSVLFDPFFQILRSNYSDPRDIQIILSAAMLLWDRAEPTGFSKYIREGSFPDTPPHEILLQVAIGDHQVSNFGSHIMARTIGVPQLAPVNRSVWGIEEVESGHVGSAMIEHDFGLPPVPQDNVPMREGNDPHAILWNYDAGIDELEHFLRTGEVMAFCEGPCDPE